MNHEEKIIHERIKQLRIANGLSMKEFAERIGTSLDGVWRWEHSRLPSALKIVAIAKEFGVSADWLLGLSEAVNLGKDRDNLWRLSSMLGIDLIR